MVHAEQFRLRTNSDAGGDCHDYIGFQLHISSTSFFYDITQFSTQDLVSRSTSFYLDIITITNMMIIIFTTILEFGREDNLPFWTTERSGKLCGVRRDVNYEV